MPLQVRWDCRSSIPSSSVCPDMLHFRVRLLAPSRGESMVSSSQPTTRSSRNASKMVKQLETKLNSRALNGRDCGDDNKGAERGENEKEREGDIYLAEGNTPRSPARLSSSRPPPPCALCALSTASPLHSDLAGMLTFLAMRLRREKFQHSVVQGTDRNFMIATFCQPNLDCHSRPTL